MLFNLQIHQFTKLNQIIFQDFCWKVSEQESWAIIGNIGTGKTILLKILSGLEYLPLQDGQLFFKENITQEDIAFVSFLDEKKWIKRADFYYQQRYYTSFTDEEMKLYEFFELEKINDRQKENIQSLLKKYHLENLLNVPFIQLSNGQKNKSILIKSLQLNCKILLLDNPFIGIDAASRKEIFKLIDELIGSGKHVVYTSNYPVFATSTTHILQLYKNKKPAVFLKKDYPENETSTIQKQNISENSSCKKIIELQHVNIKYHEKIILDNISWTVFEGEKWAILGENGSGKSTLLSLLYADHPQSYKNHILLFDEPRRTQSIWEIKARTGYLSSEFHLHFLEPLNVAETIATGFTDTLSLQRKPTSEQADAIEKIIKALDIEHLKNRQFLSLSFGEQRLVLFARAVIKNPDLLILDEAYQGFDKETIALCNHYIDTVLPKKTTLIFTSHYAEELPECVHKYLHLANGKIVTNE